VLIALGLLQCMIVHDAAIGVAVNQPEVPPFLLTSGAQPENWKDKPSALADGG